MPLQPVTNSPILRPVQPPTSQVLALGDLVEELPEAISKRSLVKKLPFWDGRPFRDGRAKHRARQVHSRARCVRRLRARSASVEATRTEVQKHPNCSGKPAMEHDPDVADIDSAELQSPILAHGSVLETSPGLASHNMLDGPLFEDGSLDHIIHHGITLPPSDVSIEECEKMVGTETGQTLRGPTPVPVDAMVCGCVSEQNRPDCVSIRFGDCLQTFGPVRCLSVAQLQSQIVARFKLASRAFVLRTVGSCDAGVGCVIPPAYCLAPANVGMIFSLEVPTSLVAGSSDTGVAHGQPPSPIDEPTPLRWVQEPPHTTCQWLTAKTSDFSNGQPLRKATSHCFDPAPAVSFPGAKSDELAALLEQAEVTLWTPLFKDVSQHLHVGPCEVTFSDSGEVSMCWPAMAITELPNNVIGQVVGSTVTNCHQGGRGGKGWFHLRVEIPTIGRLWLKNRAAAGLAKIVLKHRRCVQTGRWKEREIGPYANHALCKRAGTHIDIKTGRKLCKESCCFGARKKNQEDTCGDSSNARKTGETASI